MLLILVRCVFRFVFVVAGVVVSHLEVEVGSKIAGPNTSRGRLCIFLKLRHFQRFLSEAPD
jgi:hypothetical protein